MFVTNNVFWGCNLNPSQLTGDFPRVLFVDISGVSSNNITDIFILMQKEGFGLGHHTLTKATETSIFFSAGEPKLFWHANSAGAALATTFRRNKPAARVPIQVGRGFNVGGGCCGGCVAVSCPGGGRTAGAGRAWAECWGTGRRVWEALRRGNAHFLYF